MRKLFVLFVLGILTSCSSSYQLSTLNHTPEYIGDVRVDVIDNEMELSRLLRTDDTFRWDFAQYAMNQDMRWQYDFYWDNRMFRRSAFGSPFNFYWNSHQYWWNWATNSHFNMGFNHWDPFGFNNYGMGWSYSWNNRRWSSNQWGSPYGWNNYYGWNNGFYNRYRGTNVAYHSGRRSSNNVVVGRRTNTIKNRVIVNRNKPRLVVDKDVVIDKALIKLKGNNNNIRIYENPNNVPNKIIIRNNNNSKPVRNYNRPENNNRNSNNNIRNNSSRPSRTYSPPSRSSSPVISRPPTRSSNPPVVNRSSGGSKPVIKR
jgi:hypothetical protein